MRERRNHRWHGWDFFPQAHPCYPFDPFAESSWQCVSPGLKNPASASARTACQWRRFIEIMLALARESHSRQGSFWRGSLAAPRYNRLDVKPRFHRAEDHIFSPGSKNAAQFSRTDPLRKCLRKDWRRQPRTLLVPVTRSQSGFRSSFGNFESVAPAAGAVRPVRAKQPFRRTDIPFPRTDPNFLTKHGSPIPGHRESASPDEASTHRTTHHV